MSALNAVITEDGRLLIGCDGALWQYQPDGTLHAFGTTNAKFWRLRRGPIYVGARGAWAIAKPLAFGFILAPWLDLAARPERLARFLSIYLRWLTLVREPPPDRREVHVVVAGWDRRRRCMFVHEFSAKSRAAGFVVERHSDGAAIGPYDPELDHLVAPQTVSAMARLLAAQCTMMTRWGAPEGGLPYHVVEVEPGGRVTRHVIRELPTPSPMAAFAPHMVSGGRGLG
ncbi:MAG: hypothetical protein AB7J30_12570 [Hyphomicrobium sp.]|uniref:hypothetical protein n=1 Tax=Hyphomicrobium sp. TaxID=82 RepID=UPI003D1013DD